MSQQFRFSTAMPLLTRSVSAWRAELRRIEDLGYWSVAISDHFTRGWVMEPLVAMTAAAEATSTYEDAGSVNPFGPVEGSRYAGARRVPVSYQRIGRTVDLTDVPATDVPTLQMKLSYSTLTTFHHVIVEAAPSGTDEWTTLPDLNGRTMSGPPTTCGTAPLCSTGAAKCGSATSRTIARARYCGSAAMSAAV